MEYGTYDNPYAVPAVQNVSMVESPRHEGGNAVAANSEARVVAEVKAQVLMARQFPRDPGASCDRILKECARPTLADAAVYSFPRGKETVTGPSIRLAEVLARQWGNCTYGLEVLERKVDKVRGGSSVVRAYAWDLETNTYISRQFEVKHYRQTKSGGYAITDDRDIYELEANMGSRRMRACILQMIPGDVTQAAVMACRKTSSSGISQQMSDPKGREKVITGTIKVFGKMGITQEDLEEYLSAKVADWNADMMLRLKELKASIDDNMVNLGDIFPRLAQMGQNAVISKDQVKTLMELAAKSGKQQEISDGLKKAGIAKMADIPVDRYESILKWVTGLLPQEEEKQPESPEDPAETANG